MLILIPWKPVVIVWGLLSAMILFGYFAGSLMKGQNPFAEFRLPPQHNILLENHLRHTRLRNRRTFMILLRKGSV